MAASTSSAPIAYATRVDKTGMRYQVTRAIRIAVIVIYAVISLIPVYWMITAAFKSRPDVVAIPPKVFFVPTIEGFVSLLTKRILLPPAQSNEYQARTDLNFAERLMAERGQRITGPSQYGQRLLNSVIVASATLPEGAGNVFAADLSAGGAPAPWGGPLARLSWTDEQTLVTAHDRAARILMARDERDGVRVTYRDDG